MATIVAPLRELIKTDVHFQWNSMAEDALTHIKKILSTQPVLQFFDPAVTSVIQADASQYGLGACLLQRGKPVAYASHSLSSNEINYAQIEKELLAIVKPGARRPLAGARLVYLKSLLCGCMCVCVCVCVCVWMCVCPPPRL